MAHKKAKTGVYQKVRLMFSGEIPLTTREEAS